MVFINLNHLITWHHRTYHGGRRWGSSIQLVLGPLYWNKPFPQKSLYWYNSYSGGTQSHPAFTSPFTGTFSSHRLFAPLLLVHFWKHFHFLLYSWYEDVRFLTDLDGLRFFPFFPTKESLKYPLHGESRGTKVWRLEEFTFLLQDKKIRCFKHH